MRENERTRQIKGVEFLEKIETRNEERHNRERIRLSVLSG